MRGVKGSSEHGTRSKYVLGCRCEWCRAADHAYRSMRPRPHRVATKHPRYRTEAGSVAADRGFDVLEEAILIALGSCEESQLHGASLPARPFTLDEMAEIYGVTRQAISQTCSRALDKLRYKLSAWRDVA